MQFRGIGENNDYNTVVVLDRYHSTVFMLLFYFAYFFNLQSFGVLKKQIFL